MDADCKNALSPMASRGSQICICLAKELERIHLGHYSKEYLEDAYKKDVHMLLTSSDCSNPHLQELARISRSIKEDTDILLLEAGKRLQSTSDKESRQQLHRLRLVHSDCMCSSASGERAWVELSKEAVDAYVSWLKGRGAEKKEKVAARRTEHAVVFSGAAPPLLLMGLQMMRRGR